MIYKINPFITKFKITNLKTKLSKEIYIESIKIENLRKLIDFYSNHPTFDIEGIK